jgi:hypothetical protein
VFSAPLRWAASTTIVAPANAAITLLRARKRHLVGAVPHGTSASTSPVRAIAAISSS